MEIAITTHGNVRLKERVGLKGNSQKELALRAYVKGKCPIDFGKELRSYLENVLRYSSGDTIRVWSNQIWIYGNGHLITSWVVPQKLWLKEKMRKEYGKRNKKFY